MTYEELNYIVTLMREEADRRRAAFEEVRKPANDLHDGYITPDEIGMSLEELDREYEKRRERLSQAEAYISLFLSYDWHN